MSISVAQLVQRLTEHGLVADDELEAWLSEHGASDADALLKHLRAQGKLTGYQAEALAADPPLPIVLGKYVILERIGAGGMGQVLKAQHRRMKRMAAIKMLAAELTDSAEATQRFHREVEAAARLSHPNIVITHDADECDGTHYLVMELVEGRDLSSVVAEAGPLPASVALKCVLQAARGLEYAHAQGIVHRDIKPSNLLLTSEGNVKILDMGLARLTQSGVGNALDESHALTATGQVMGTVDYMAPEQAEDAHAADGRADIYSLGCTLYHLLTGRVPYGGKTLMKRLLAHREAKVPSLREARADMPASLDVAFAKMVAKNPADRYQSMREVIDALTACEAQIDEHAGEQTIVEATEVVAPEPTVTAKQTATLAGAEPSPATVELGETVLQPQAPTGTAASLGAAEKLAASTASAGNKTAVLGFIAGVLALALSVLTGWVPCAGVVIVAVPVTAALVLGAIGRAAAGQGRGHGRKALAAMALALMAIVATTVLQLWGGGRLVQMLIDAGKAQFQREQQWWAVEGIWQPPPEDASPEQLFPAEFAGFRRGSIDNNAALPQLDIDLAGHHAPYRASEVTLEAYVWRANKLEREAIFSRIEQAIRDDLEDDETNPTHMRMSYGGAEGAHRWVVNLADGQNQAAMWWSGGWLFMLIGDDDPDRLLREWLLAHMSAADDVDQKH